MLTGFRAGADPLLGLTTDNFSGTRAAWRLPPGTATIGRVFPDGPHIDPLKHTPEKVVAKLEAACAPVLAAGMDPFPSLKPNVAATLDGALDDHFAAAGRWMLAQGRRFVFTVWHEPENDLMDAAAADYIGRGTNFVRVYVRVYRILKEILGDVLTMGPCHMGYQWQAGMATTADGPTAQAWMVPTDARDVMMLDTYTSNSSVATRGVALRERTDVQRWMRLLEVTGEQLLLAERGISRTLPAPHTGDVVQADILRADTEYLLSIGAHAMLYWNSTGASDGSEFRLAGPGRETFRQCAVFAAAAHTAYTRGHNAAYAAGFTAGTQAGAVDGHRTGREEAFREVESWAAGQT